MPADPIAERFFTLLAARGITVAAAARTLGVARPTVALLRTRPASLDRWHAYAVALGIDPHQLDPRLASAAPRK